MFRIVGILGLLALASLPAVADESVVHARIKQSLTCQVDPLGTVRDIAREAKNKYDSGYTGFDFGEEMQYTAIVALRSPIVIAGAKANNVVAGTVAFYDNFIGLVHARFTGDYKKVVAELGLRRNKSGTSFSKRMKVDSRGKPDNVCPMTIELKPLENGEFVLGCGWCNG